jgi:hypothetical protein
MIKFVEGQISFLGSTLIVPIIILVWEVVHLVNFLWLFKQSVCLVYFLSFHNCHDWNGISITEIVDLVLLVNNLNECKETNVIRFFHLINIPSLYIISLVLSGCGGGRPLFHPFVPSSMHPSSSSWKKKMMEEEEDDEWR